MEKSLIPGLPYDVSLQIMARVPRQFYSQHMSKVSLSWREAVTSRALFAQRKWLQVTESWVYTGVVCEHENRPCILWFARNLSAEDSEWWPLPLMKEEHRPIYGFSCAVIGELMLVMGGCEWHGNRTSFPASNKVSVFNGRTNQWSCVQGMKHARSNFACGVVNGKVYVAGGESSVDVGAQNSEYKECNCLKSSEIYYPLTNEWEGVREMIHSMHFVRGRVVDNKFRVCGFACEGYLQFCEVAEVLEETEIEMKWVQILHEESESDVSLLETDCECQGKVIENESALIASLSNAFVDVENEEEIEDFECGRNLRASIVIVL